MPTGLETEQDMNLRQTMPTVAAWADELREVFGKESVNAALRRGEFWAKEAGMEIGTRPGVGYVPASHGPLKTNKK